MNDFLLKIIDSSGNVAFDDKFKIGRVHLDSFREFSKENNLEIALSTDQMAALDLASKGYISILNVRIGYLFFLPSLNTLEQIKYLEEQIPNYEKIEDRICEVAIYSEEKVYYNNCNYRDLLIEEKIEILEGKKEKTEDIYVLLKNELVKQKEKLSNKNL